MENRIKKQNPDVGFLRRLVKHKEDARNTYLKTDLVVDLIILIGSLIGIISVVWWIESKATSGDDFIHQTALRAIVVFSSAMLCNFIAQLCCRKLYEIEQRWAEEMIQGEKYEDEKITANIFYLNRLSDRFSSAGSVIFYSSVGFFLLGCMMALVILMAYI